MMERRTGSCLCGAVKFSAVPQNDEIVACHCGMCRKMVGGSTMAVDCGDTLKFENAESLSWFQSSDWGERGFCTKCGSNMFWRLQDKSMNTVHVGAFDDLAGMRFTTEIFVDHKPDYYAFAGVQKMMTEAEVIEAFMAGKNS